MIILRVLQNSVGILFIWITIMLVDKRVISVRELVKGIKKAHKLTY